MANHQFACLAPQNANHRGFIAIWQLIPCRFSLLRQKRAVFVLKALSAAA
jgi:hypothetical protein